MKFDGDIDINVHLRQADSLQRIRIYPPKIEGIPLFLLYSYTDLDRLVPLNLN